MTQRPTHDKSDPTNFQRIGGTKLPTSLTTITTTTMTTCLIGFPRNERDCFQSSQISRRLRKALQQQSPIRSQRTKLRMHQTTSFLTPYYVPWTVQKGCIIDRLTYT